MTEINPNHPMTQAMHNQWHKVCAILMARHGIEHIVITSDDVALLNEKFGEERCLLAQELHDGLHLRVVDTEEAMRLLRKHGGLPV